MAIECGRIFGMQHLVGGLHVRNPFLSPTAGGRAVVIVWALLSASVAGQDKPSGGIPRMPDGKPDLSGVWDHPFVIDMSKDLVDREGKPTNNCGAQYKGCSQKGPGGELPMTAWGWELFKNYDPEKFDPTGHCNPMGYTRSMNAPVPTQ